MLKLQDGQCCETRSNQTLRACRYLAQALRWMGIVKPDVTSAPERSRIPGEMQAHRSLMLLAGSISDGPSRSRRIGSLGVELDMAFVCQTGLPRRLFHQSI